METGRKVKQKFKAGGELGPQIWPTETNAGSRSKSVDPDKADTDRLVTGDVSMSAWWKRQAGRPERWRRDKGLSVTSALQATLCKSGRDCLSQSQHS